MVVSRRELLMGAAALLAAAGCAPAYARKKPHPHPSPTSTSPSPSMSPTVTRPTVTPTPTPSGGVTHGIQVNASNTGLTGKGLTAADMTGTLGATTYSTPGQVITRKRFTGQVTIAATGVILRECLLDGGDGTGIFPGDNSGVVHITANSALVEDCTIVAKYPGTGTDMCGVFLADTVNSVTVQRCNISKYANAIRFVNNDGTVIQYNYIHHPVPYDGGSTHRDCIEIFVAQNTSVYRNRIEMDDEETACVNLAPWYTGTINNNNFDENHFDGGNFHTLVDSQSASPITRTRFRDNTMGGHTNTPYTALNNADSRSIVTSEAALTANTSAILWTGNTWQETQRVDATLSYAALSPNRDGQAAA